MFSTEADTDSDFVSHGDVLLATARTSIRQGLELGDALRPDLDAMPEPLLEPGACFVTLHLAGDLRGCIGSLEAARPLIEDVAVNAHAAAFRDPRFGPLREDEFELVLLDISVLTPAVPLAFSSEADLLAQLRAGVDGLVLEAAQRRATFLPSVWEALPDPDQFLRELKRKAGLPADFWDEELKAWRYTTVSVAERP